LSSLFYFFAQPTRGPGSKAFVFGPRHSLRRMGVYFACLARALVREAYFNYTLKVIACQERTEIL
jgi:hypothetical protein